MTLPASDFRLVDRRRGMAYQRPRLRGVSHLLAFGASLVLGALIIVKARGAVATAAAAIYAGCVSGLFGVSGLYHSVRWRPGVRRWFQRLDHAMVFMLIAGTYTPVLLVATHGRSAHVLLVIVWTIAVVGLLAHGFWIDAPEWLVGGLYVGLGWIAVVALPGVWREVGVLGGTLTVAGGLLYTAGALGYHRRWPDPVPTVFGYHEIFHALVIAAAACHYVLIGVLIL